MLKERVNNTKRVQARFVLILILMEHAQRVRLVFSALSENGLNPYFNGTCSKRHLLTSVQPTKRVLILILMEHAQRGHFL